VNKIKIKLSELKTQLESLADKGLYTRGKIDWWLLKYEKPYQSVCNNFSILKAEFPDTDIDGHKMLKREFAFKKLYESLNEVSDCYRSQNLDKELVNINEIITDFKY